MWKLWECFKSLEQFHFAPLFFLIHSTVPETVSCTFNKYLAWVFVFNKEFFVSRRVVNSYRVQKETRFGLAAVVSGLGVVLNAQRSWDHLRFGLPPGRVRTGGNWSMLGSCALDTALMLRESISLSVLESTCRQTESSQARWFSGRDLRESLETHPKPWNPWESDRLWQQRGLFNLSKSHVTSMTDVTALVLYGLFHQNAATGDNEFFSWSGHQGAT